MSRIKKINDHTSPSSSIDDCIHHLSNTTKLVRTIKKHAKELVGLWGLALLFTYIQDEGRSSINLRRNDNDGNLRGKDLEEAMAYAQALQQPATIHNTNNNNNNNQESSKALSLYIPPTYDTLTNRRTLSLNLGNGQCEWQPPTYEVPTTLDFHKTIIAGFPSGDKRMIFTQMEALTGWPAKDEWDFEYLGMSNHPFIKANYPHHEGVWGWEQAADQVVMMVRNIRRSMVEYHDILWDIGYAKTWDEATLNLDNLYSERPPMEDFLEWRDLRVMDEIQWYGWFIDYWMEGGLMRDIFTHQLTTPEHWYMLMMPTVYTREELDYGTVVGNQTVVTPSYDPHCDSENGDVTDGCEPVAVISAEKLRDYDDGPAETTAIANVLLNDDRTGQYVIAQEAWDCIWEELIVNGKGLKTVFDRPGFVEEDYNFSSEMLEEMINELTRLINKYTGPDWNTKETAQKVALLLFDHRSLIQTELVEVLAEEEAGTRKLADKDFLGPRERANRRRRTKDTTTTADPVSEGIHAKYFQDLDAKIWKARQKDMKHRSLESAREERIKQRAVRLVRKAMREESKGSSSAAPKKEASLKKMQYM